MAARVTQLTVEAVIASTSGSARVTQIAVEAVITDAASARVTQLAAEVVISPTSQKLVVSQAGIEVARYGNPNLAVSQAGLEVARFGDPGLLVSQFGIEVAYEVPKGTFSLDARLVADDGYPDRRSNWTTLDAWLKKTQVGSFPVSAVIKATVTPTGFKADAYKSLRFFLDAQIGYWFRVEAEIVPRHFAADASIVRTITSGFPADAVRLATVTKNDLLVAAVIKRTQAGTGWTLDARIMPRFRVDAFIQPWFWTDAVLLVTVESSFTLGAQITPYFLAEAFIQPYFRVDARLEYGFFANAIIKRTMGVPGILPLSYPGVSRTLYGNTANALTPLFVVSPGDQMIVRVVNPPSDGGDLGAFNVSATLSYGITASPGEYVFPVLPGLYYIFSSKNNVYRPFLTGSGTYANYGTSSLGIVVDAFVQPVFRVDANFVWTFTFPVAFDATLRKTMPASFSVGAFIQPFMRVDAEIVPLHFTVGAWIKCEFPVDAWLIYRIVSSFPASAFVQPVFRVNAIRRKVQAKTFTVSSWFTNPRYGNFNASSWILGYFHLGAHIKVTKYRRFTASSWKILHVTGSLSADAFVQPTFRTDAVIYRPAESLDPVPSFTLDTRLVKLVFGDFAVGAFIEGYARIDAIKLETFSSSVALDAAMVWKIYGSFTVGAGITGFLTNAVIKARQTAIFTLFAWKDILHPARMFLVQAEKRDPGAYWDPETETWLHMHFLVDALLAIHPAGATTVDATLIEDGTPLGSFTVNGLVSSPAMYGELLLEADISTLRTVVYEGAGEVVVERHLINERLSYPGIPSPLRGNDNTVYGPFWPPDFVPVTITLWDFPAGNIGIYSVNEDKSAAPARTVVFWPSYSDEPHYVYSWTTGAYDPSLTGSGMVSFYRDDTVTLSLPAPTLDAWIVGTLGEPFTLDAEIVEREKLGFLYLDADLMKAGEQRGTFAAGAHLMAPQSFPFFVFATIVAQGFTADAVIRQPNLTADAFIQPYFTVNAVILWTFSWYPLAPAIDAVLVRGQGSGSFVAGADVAPVGEMRGTIPLEALVLGPRVRRFYLAAVIPPPDVHFNLDAFIGHRLTVDAWIGTTGGGIGGFSVGAYVRGSSIIVFPEVPGPRTVTDAVISGTTLTSATANFTFSDVGRIVTGPGIPPGTTIVSVISSTTVIISQTASPGTGVTVTIGGGGPTDPLGNAPVIGRSFSVKIEAFIPDPIPIGNDQYIEELIMKILEAEAELDALFCAVEHYSSQGYPVAGGRNSYGGGYTGSLPNAISQIGYPGAGDIDDCWVVATVWAAIASGQTFQPTATQFRSWARNPDRPGATGGTLDHIMRGARGAWPGATIRRYASSDWDGFTSLLKAGWTASLAVRSSGLPSSYRYGFNGLHQVGVAYQGGTYVIMNPLQSNGSNPRTIDGYDLRTAARGFTGGTICACMFR